jgi:hypothetical protein
LQTAFYRITTATTRSVGANSLAWRDAVHTLMDRLTRVHPRWPLHPTIDKGRIMQLLEREKLDKEHLPGRIIEKAVGKGSASSSGKMTMGFAHYSAESGPMEPHHHAEEIVYILSAENGWVREGQEQDGLGDPMPLAAGMILHIPELEWHVFEYGEGGHVDIIFFYGQVDHIRPEEIASR